MRLHLFCLVSQKPVLLLNSSLRSRRTETQVVLLLLCACLYQCNRRSKCRRSLVVLALVCRQARRFASWFFGTGWLLWWWSRETKILGWAAARFALLLAAVAFWWRAGDGWLAAGRTNT